ncbi:MAG TPA: WXG100 family type VII secretion target [Pseudonocardiaceae bacterium]|jgi:early secretory antigenic target protein ESAT-6|nr:WXG100 family type VII secretion target [Pseudonocardiaceae bacterium]
MTDQIQVSFGAIDQLAGTVDSQVKQIEAQLEDLRQAIQKLGTTWTGASDEAFQAVQTNWNQSATDLNGVLNRIAVAVHAAHDSYVSTENKNTSVWNG